ncbi:MAG: DUF4292 domain-containing protein [Ignavibacteriae bacterium]|nr:DUF4292 domain-containing protein [Ignavibacteriota bacterium]
MQFLNHLYLKSGFIFILFLIGCSSVPKQRNELIKQSHIWNDEIKSLNISANVTSKYHDDSNSGFCRLILAGTDSLSLKITGPFDIMVGRLFANNRNFIFFDAFNNQIIEGKPTAQNLKRATMVPLDFGEFIRLLRCEVPSDPNEFVPDDSYSKSDGILYKNTENKDYIEYALYSSETNNLIRYQRKLKSGQLILDLIFKDYDSFDGFQFAKYIIFNFLEFELKVDMQVTNIDVNKDINKKLSFTLPEGIRSHKIE